MTLTNEYLKLKKSNCKNCYKCIRSCPVKSIRFSGNQAHIVGDACILCGQCFVVCPQNAKVIQSDTERAKQLIFNGDVVVSVAPSFAASFEGASIRTMEAALKQLGFIAAEETAIGAGYVKTRYEEILKAGSGVLISSCCHTVNLLIRKYYPEALHSLARVMSPMAAHCQSIKERYSGAKTVFIGPCISKKAEADDYDGIVDCVLTFEELNEWFAAEGINVAREHLPPDQCGTERFFPTSGGILKTMEKLPDRSYIHIDGLDNCIKVLEELCHSAPDGAKRCFIEMSACAGSCTGGPVAGVNRTSPLSDFVSISRYAGTGNLALPETKGSLVREHSYLGLNRTLPSSAEINEVLRKMGKTKPEDELNCSTCGYNTCREKAVAICQGKADLTMCLPFLKDRAESFSDNIISNTPNAIIVLNEALEIQQINNAALKLTGLTAASDVLGEHIIRLFTPTDFFNVMDSGKNIHDKKLYLAEYGKYLEETVIYDKSYHILICILRDVTEAETIRRRKELVSASAIEITDNVIDKQMRAVQEIALLLGETAAETKIALSKLKGSLTDE
ncbi:MAG: [Fe-Fe] hydrogenase large subunit C-terminal domain-containing protein [Oscillospiraceae bacterium]